VFEKETDRAAVVLGKYEHPAKAEAFRAEMHNLLLEAENKELKDEVKNTKEQAGVLVHKLQIEEDESVPVLLFTTAATGAATFLAGQAAQQWIKTNYPDNSLLKYAIPIVGTALSVGTVMLEQVTDEERAQGLRPDYMVMAFGVGGFGGAAAGASKQLYDDYKAANP
jgi:hypothetical protein